ncbi:MAG: hypothetical protein GYA36_19660 [Veillonellaceae bacterium]|nr:hypothetical protein [Veillonellaceae bacterium]
MQKILDPDSLEYSTLERVRERAREQGLQEPRRPKGVIPDVPLDLSSRGGSFLVDLYRELVAWYEFSSFQAAIADLKSGEWKNNLGLLLKAHAKDGMAPEEIETDETVIAVRKALQVSEQEATLWGNQKSNLDRLMKMVSRSVEVLKLEAEKGQRSGGIGEKPWPFRNRKSD